MRGTTLVRLLDMVRAEARLSLNPAHNNQTRDTHVLLIQREQERLWEDYTWGHLRVERTLHLASGQRFFQPPEDLDLDRIETVQAKTDGEWWLLRNGIGPSEYAAHDSELGNRAWPPNKWRIFEDEQLEIWPIPDQDYDATTGNAALKITGIRKLRPLVKDIDVADIDDRLIALYVAAGILAARGEKDASFKLEMASKRLATLKGNMQPARKFRMFGVGHDDTPRRQVITRYRAPGVV